MQLGALRYAALDGLRGIAALVVVTYHCLLVVPAVSAIYVDDLMPAEGSPAWWLYSTPLRLAFAGHEAVLIFFVLSGFVLALPTFRRPPGARGWLAYYPRRLCRLYLPVWGALLVAAALAAAVARDTSAPDSWLASHRPLSGHVVLRDAMLLTGTSNLDSPLWSLRWEVWFSLLLPFLVGVALMSRARRGWPLGILVLIGLSVASKSAAVAEALPTRHLTRGLLEYLPVFGIGVLLAIGKDDLDRVWARLSAARIAAALAGLLTVAALALVACPSLVGRRGHYGGTEALAYGASLLGVAVLFFLAFESPGAARLLESRPVQWLGRRSFSLFLVHEPLVVALALRVRPDGWLPWLYVAAAALPFLLLAAELFYRIVERPAQRLSHWVGVRIDPPRTPERALGEVLVSRV